MCALGHGTYRLDGVERMRERPIGDLLNALNQLGANCSGGYRDGFPPVIVDATGLRGGMAAVSGETSSQFLSGILIAAPYAAEDVQLLVTPEAMVIQAEDGTAAKKIFRPSSFRDASMSAEPKPTMQMVVWS